MPAILPFVLAAAASGVLAFALTPLASLLATAVGAVDMPGDRKIHNRPVPRLGGLAVVSAVAIVWTLAATTRALPFLPSDLLWALGLGVLPILAISVMDDVRSVRARSKFGAHVLGALIAVTYGVSVGSQVHLFGVPIDIGYAAVPLSVLWIVGVTNAFNIIDGLDGLSAGLALIAASSMAAVFFMVGQPATAAAVLVIAGALAGFLPYNLHPARLFLGDTGATAIGFGLACLALKGGSTLSGGFAALVPVFIMGLPIADTLIAMARRLLGRSEKPGASMFVADRNHIHHRLLALGLDHGTAVITLYGVGLLLAGVGFASMFVRAREASLFLLALVLAGFVGLNRLGYDEFAFIRRGTALKVYEAPVVKRSMFVVFVDLAIVLCASYVSVALKHDVWNWTAIGSGVLELAGTLAPLTVIVFWKSGMYKGAWRLAGVEDLVRACGATLAVSLLALIAHSVWPRASLPASVFLIYALASTLIVAASRASYVVLRSSQRRARSDGTAVLIYGAGQDGVSAMRELFTNAQSGLRPVGFIDDDVRKVGSIVSGLPVVATVSGLKRAMLDANASAVLVATPSIPPARVHAASDVCRQLGAGLFRMHVHFDRLVDNGAIPAPPQPFEWPDELPPMPAQPMESAVDVDAQTCSTCGGMNVHRSHARNLYERVKKLHTAARLHRCHDCGWRGWLVPLTRSVAIENILSVDVSALDRAMDGPPPGF